MAHPTPSPPAGALVELIVRYPSEDAAREAAAAHDGLSCGWTLHIHEGEARPFWPVLFSSPADAAAALREVTSCR